MRYWLYDTKFPYREFAPQWLTLIKEQEREHLEYFLRARQSAIGEQLTLVCDSEAPDFICRHSNGEMVGVGPTKIIYQPEQEELLNLCRARNGAQP